MSTSSIPKYAVEKHVTISPEQNQWIIRKAEEIHCSRTEYIYQILHTAVQNKEHPSFLPKTKGNPYSIGIRVRVSTLDKAKITQEYTLTDYVRRIIRDRMTQENQEAVS